MGKDLIVWKSPTLETAARLLAAAGFRLGVEPVHSFEVVVDGQGRPFTVPDRLPGSRSGRRWHGCGCPST